MAEDVDDLRDRLRGIAEELADLALDRLRHAVDDTDDADADEPGRAAAEERRLTRARRAVEKAAGLLDEPERG